MGDFTIPNWGPAAAAPTSSMQFAGWDGGGKVNIDVGTLLAKGYPTGDKTIVGGASAGKLILKGSENDTAAIVLQPSGGNVGIGAPNPVQRLFVQGTTSTEIIQIRTLATNGAAGIRMQNDAQTWGVDVNGIDNYIIRDVNAATVPFTIEPGAPTDSLYINPSGNVGLGTASPGVELDVVGAGTPPTPDARTVGRFTNALAAGNFAAIAIISGTSGSTEIEFGDTDDEDFARFGFDHSNGHYYFRTEAAATKSVVIDGAAGANSLVVDANGDVMLGDSTARITGLTIRPGGDAGSLPSITIPGVVIANTSSTTDDVALYLAAGTSGLSRILFADSGGTQGQIIYRHFTDQLEFLAAGQSGLLEIDSGEVTVNENGANVDFRVEGDTRSHTLCVDASTDNLILVGTTIPAWQSMVGGCFLTQRGAVPTGNPTGGIYIWSAGGAGVARGTGGTVTTWAPAEPHCSACGSDFWRTAYEWRDESDGDKVKAWLYECGWCGEVYRGGDVDFLSIHRDRKALEHGRSPDLVTMRKLRDIKRAA